MPVKQIKKLALTMALCTSMVAAMLIPAKAGAASKSTEEATLAANRVYVMYIESCPMCSKALDYLDENEAGNPYIERVDLNTKNGKALLEACRQKFGFKNVIVPLICADEEYSMGWGGSVGDKIKEMSKHAETVY